MSAFVAVGIGIAFGTEIAIEGHFDIDADTDSDPGISEYQLHFRDGYETIRVFRPPGHP